MAANANDLQSGDLLIGVGVPFFTQIASGAILLARNGTLSVFCQSPPGSDDPNYFSAPSGIIADSQGRVVFLAAVGASGSLAVYAPGFALFRCDSIGATPEKLGYFPTTSALEPGYPVPVAPGLFYSGETFQPVTGLHLIKLNTVSLTDLAAGVTSQDAYSMVVADVGSTNAESVRYRTVDQIWEADSQVLPLRAPGESLPDAINHSGVTYSTNTFNIEKAQDPLTIEASGTIGGIGFTVTLNLFGSANAFPPGSIEYNTALPTIGSGCIPAPPLVNTMPVDTAGHLVPLGGTTYIVYDEFTGNGLVGTTDYAPAEGPWLTNITEALLDNPGDPTQYFQQGYAGCVAVPFVPLTVPLPFTGPPPEGFSNAPSFKPASSVNGLVAPRFFSTAAGGGDVIQMTTSGGQAELIVTGAQIAATGFAYPDSIAAYPNGASAGATVTVILRVDSPVNVLITDPNGKQLGVDALGNPHDDLTATNVNPITGGSQNFNNGFDSGPGEPRFFAIKNPVPGTYNVQSVGIGSGPYTVHVYSVNTSQPTGQAILTTGTASVGSTGSESFTLDGGGNIAFINVGVPGPTIIPSSEVSTTASGLVYSRVSQTFNGTVTVKNIGTSTISGPLQIVMMSLPAGITLSNATGTFVGNAYITALDGGLAPGQSSTVVVQFKNPANATIHFTPVIYSGSL